MWTIEYSALDCQGLLLAPLSVVVRRFPTKQHAEEWLDCNVPRSEQVFTEETEWNGRLFALRVRFVATGDEITITRVTITGAMCPTWRPMAGPPPEFVALCRTERERCESEFMRWLDADDDAWRYWCNVAREYLDAGMVEDA